MRLLLVSPPFYRLLGSHYNGIYLGQCYIASLLNKNGHDVKIYNADHESRKKYLNQKEIFENIESYKNILNDKEHYIWREIEQHIRDFSPEAVGITMYSATFKSSYIISEIIKKIDKNIKIIVGGIHPTLNPKETLENTNYDFLVLNEGEYPTLSIANGEDSKTIPGIFYRNKEGVHFTEESQYIKDLDELPFPERKKFIINQPDDVSSIMAGRGCPFSCSYCCSPVIWKRRVRFRSVENIIEELKLLKNDFNSKLIHFHDDTMTLSPKRAIDICKGIINNKLDIQWTCNTRVDRLDEELMGYLKEAGCIRVKISVESGNDDTLKRVGKRFTTQDVLNAVKILNDFEMPFTTFLMIGFPWETDENVKQTIEFAKSLKADYYSLSILSPYYGTELYNILEKESSNLKKEHWEYFFHQSKEMIMNTKISPGVVEEFFELNDLSKGERI